MTDYCKVGGVDLRKLIPNAKLTYTASDGDRYQLGICGDSAWSNWKFPVDGSDAIRISLTYGTTRVVTTGSEIGFSISYDAYSGRRVKLNIECDETFPTEGRVTRFDGNKVGYHTFWVEARCGLRAVSPSTNTDLGIRFSKFGEITGHHNDEARTVYYPLVPSDAAWLRDSTQAHSVIIADDCYSCAERAYHFDIVNDVLGGLPTYPTRSSDAPYWQELVTVVQTQQNRRANVTLEYPLPFIWADYSVGDVTHAVHDEIPGAHHMALLDYLVKDGAEMKRSVVPAQSDVDFVRGPIALSAINGAAIQSVSPINFQTKWLAGRPRPEEVAWQIASGKLTAEDGVPRRLITAIQSMNLADQFSFTAYEEGSPLHPSWPAMHSAGASGSLWMAVVLDLTPKQVCEARITDYAIAFARTTAGVHYPSDNIAGLKLGYYLVAQWLPEYLATTFGADRNVVEDRIKEVSAGFSWDTFTASSCYKGRL